MPANDLKRYGFFGRHTGENLDQDAEPCEDGTWVKHADAQAALAAKDAAIRSMLAEMRDAYACYTHDRCKDILEEAIEKHRPSPKEDADA